MAKKKKKNRPRPPNKVFHIGDNKVEVCNFDGGMMGVKRRSCSQREIADIELDEHWARCLDYFRGRCVYCLRKPIKGEILTRDHFIAKDNGGKNIATNIVPACTFCNGKKSNKNPRIWCTDEQLERIYTYFWDFRISLHKGGRHTVIWKAIGLGE
jgi:hypothetical protein